jgi:uncharacterized membrane protein
MQALVGEEGILLSLVRMLRLALEGVGAFWVAVGFAFAFGELVIAHVRWQVASFTRIRLTFSRYLSLALEFQLASDILSTSIAPTWTEIGKLAATAVIRTSLNYVLSREIREYAVSGGRRLGQVQEGDWRWQARRRSRY